jgi:hypothetical protein
MLPSIQAIFPIGFGSVHASSGFTPNPATITLALSRSFYRLSPNYLT